MKIQISESILNKLPNFDIIAMSMDVSFKETDELLLSETYRAEYRTILERDSQMDGSGLRALRFVLAAEKTDCIQRMGHASGRHRDLQRIISDHAVVLRLLRGREKKDSGICSSESRGAPEK